MEEKRITSHREDDSPNSWSYIFDNLLYHKRNWKMDFIGLRTMLITMEDSETSDMPFPIMLSLKDLIASYNYTTNLKHFIGEDTVRSSVSGFGGGLGVVLDFNIIDNKYCVTKKGWPGYPLEWCSCTAEYMVKHFMTEQQWELYNLIIS